MKPTVTDKVQLPRVGHVQENRTLYQNYVHGWGVGWICVLELCARYFMQNRLIPRGEQHRAKENNRTGYWEPTATRYRREILFFSSKTHFVSTSSIVWWTAEAQNFKRPPFLPSSSVVTKMYIHPAIFRTKTDSRLLNPEPASETFCFTCTTDDVIHKRRSQRGSWAACGSRMSLLQPSFKRNNIHVQNLLKGQQMH